MILEVSITGVRPKVMIYNRNPMKIDDLGGTRVPLFMEITIGGKSWAILGYRKEFWKQISQPFSGEMFMGDNWGHHGILHVCIYIYICVYSYIYKCVSLYIYIYIYICIFIYSHIYISIHLYIFI